MGPDSADAKPRYDEGYPPQQHPSWWQIGSEPVREPELPIFDAHFHLLARAGRARYLLDEFQADVAAGGHRIIGSLFIESGANYLAEGPEELRSVGQADWLADLIAGDERGQVIRGMLGGDVDFLRGSAVSEVLDAHIEAGRGLVRGFRDRVSWSSDPGFRRHGVPGRMAMPSYQDGVRQLADRGLVLDCWMYSEQLPEFTALVRAVPNVQFVLDHLGGPLGVGPFATDRPAMLERWREDLRILSRYPNVAVKIGGLGLPIFGMGFESRTAPPGSDEIAARWKPEIMFVIDQFGVERAMLESDFPIDKSSFSYRTVWNAHKLLTAELTPDERHQLFSGTAMRIYRVDPAPSAEQE